MNLLDALKGLISSDLVSTTANQLGESESGVRKALDVALPTVLNGVTSQLQAGGGTADGIFSFLKGADSTAMLNNLGSVVSGPVPNTGLLSMLFGNKLAETNSAVAAEAGVKTSSAASLLHLASAAVTGFLSYRINSEGMNMSGLAGFLPAALAGTTAAAATTVAYEEEKKGLGIWGWLIPALLLAALAFFLLRGCNKPAATTATVDSLKADVIAAGDTVMIKADTVMVKAGAAIDSLEADVKAKFDALGAKVGVKLPDGTMLNVPEKGVEGQLIAFLLDPATKSMTADQLKTKWFNFDRILFDTGKSTIRSASQEQIDNIAQILKAFPTLKLKFGGYTDNSGSKAGNIKLSAARAKAVMEAIAQKDNAASRLTSEGYGPEHPVAPNDTKENMEKNRRVSVRVVSL